MSFFTTFFGANAQSTDRIKILSPQDFKSSSSQKNVQLIDVRTANEFLTGHIKKAVNMDIFQQTLFVEKSKTLDKDQPVYLYCRSGVRSQKAARKLIDMGFTRIYDLQGGINKWN
jgi:rhodanese-related sulfurtransferase